MTDLYDFDGGRLLKTPSLQVSLLSEHRGGDAIEAHKKTFRR